MELTAWNMKVRLSLRMDSYCIIVQYQNEILSALKSNSFCYNPTADRQQW